MSPAARSLLRRGCLTALSVGVSLLIGWAVVTAAQRAARAPEPVPLYIVPHAVEDAGIEYRLLDRAGLHAYCRRDA